MKGTSDPCKGMGRLHSTNGANLGGQPTAVVGYRPRSSLKTTMVELQAKDFGSMQGNKGFVLDVGELARWLASSGKRWRQRAVRFGQFQEV